MENVHPFDKHLEFYTMRSIIGIIVMLSVSLLVTGEGEETGVTVVENKFETLALITKRSINEVLRGDKAYLVLFKKSSKEKNCDRCVEFNEVCLA